MKKLGISLMAIALLFVLLAIPGPATEPAPAPVGAEPFIWGQDDFWQSLETDFRSARSAGCEQARNTADEQFLRLDSDLDEVMHAQLPIGSPEWESLQRQLFQLAPLAAACADQAERFANIQSKLRGVVKENSQYWNMDDLASKKQIYSLLYGSRTALEEVISQIGSDHLYLTRGLDEPSVTPSASVAGVQVHSGDMVVSRGGAATSALIARGSDRPGNFSHVALVHVSDQGKISTIEAHIEIGVAVSTLEKYMSDKKLRLMLIRPRSTLPAITADPLLPHKAASYMLERALTSYIPYDFKMDFEDHSALFCSEVASSAYRKFGIDLWKDLSTISGGGIRSWLADFGVENFVTEEPSDLEYDPQVVIVAEWRDPEALAQDRIDNAVVDVMLEQADSGQRLSFEWYMLPVGRVLKLYSSVKNFFGSAGVVPDGMSASAALLNRSFTSIQLEHASRVREAVAAWEVENGYKPPYWQLVKIAEDTILTP